MRTLEEMREANRFQLDLVKRHRDATINLETGEFFNPVMQSVVDCGILLRALEIAMKPWTIRPCLSDDPQKDVDEAMASFIRQAQEELRVDRSPSLDEEALDELAQSQGTRPAATGPMRFLRDHKPTPEQAADWDQAMRDIEELKRAPLEALKLVQDFGGDARVIRNRLHEYPQHEVDFVRHIESHLTGAQVPICTICCKDIFQIHRDAEKLRAAALRKEGE